MYDILQLNQMLVPELREIAEKLEMKGYKRLTKKELIYKILDFQAIKGDFQDNVNATPSVNEDVKTPSTKKNVETEKVVATNDAETKLSQKSSKKEVKPKRIEVQCEN